MVNDSTQLCGLLGRIVLQPWSETSIKALGILCGCDPKLHSSVILLLFPQFLLCSLDDLSFLRSVCETNLAKSNQVIKAVAQKLKKKALSNKKLTAEEIAEISMEVTEWLAAAVMKMVLDINVSLPCSWMQPSPLWPTKKTRFTGVASSSDCYTSFSQKDRKSQIGRRSLPW